MRSRFFVFLFSGALVACFWESPASAANRPNVVVVLSDDQGYGDFSLNGNPVLKTPNLDTLARQGVRGDLLT